MVCRSGILWNSVYRVIVSFMYGLQPHSFYTGRTCAGDVCGSGEEEIAFSMLPGAIIRKWVVKDN